MRGVAFVVVLVSVAAALQLVARRFAVPHPMLLVLGGLGLARVPGLPRVTIAPDLLFVVFVPPLLYWAALTTSLRDVRERAGSIVGYATVAVLLTTAAVAVVAHALTPEFPWAAAFVLGAIVAPPDAVAAIAVLRPAGAPRAIVSLLEGEGLVNDATSLVAYQIAVAAVVTGAFSPWYAAGRFLVTGGGGVALGLAVGWLVAVARRRVTGTPIVENTLSLLTPFLAYLPADRLNVSGVLAVVAAGLYLGRRGPRIVSAAARVQAESMWTMAQFLLESGTFILVGLELPAVIRALRHHSVGVLVGYAALITLTAVGVRFAYTAAAATVLRRAARRRGGRGPSWGQAAFVGWTGMRGGDSLVIALALPLVTAAGRPFPARDLIVFLTFGVIFATLVLQGPTLVPLLHRLHLVDDGSEDVEEAYARAVTADAGLARLDELANRGPASAVALLRASFGARSARWRSRHRQLRRDQRAARSAPPAVTRRPPADDGEEGRARGYRSLRGAMVAAEREAVITLRDRGAIGDDVMRRVQRDLDMETMLLESAAEDAPDSPYDAA